MEFDLFSVAIHHVFVLLIASDSKRKRLHIFSSSKQSYHIQYVYNSNPLFWFILFKRVLGFKNLQQRKTSVRQQPTNCCLLNAWPPLGPLRRDQDVQKALAGAAAQPPPQAAQPQPSTPEEVWVVKVTATKIQVGDIIRAPTF